MQNRRDVARLPVGEEFAHVAKRLALAFDEFGFVADRLLLLVDRADLVVHDFRADLHVPDRVVAVRRRVALPHGHGVRHQLAHRRLVVVVAHYAARYPRGARANVGLVEHDDPNAVRADRFPLRSEARGEMHRCRQPVDAGTDDDVVRFGRKC